MLVFELDFQHPRPRGGEKYQFWHRQDGRMVLAFFLSVDTGRGAFLLSESESLHRMGHLLSVKNRGRL
ncbi:MAG: hypothetical protein CMP10_08530 [Zetaproteobacteria bacterium]|nr:hypothetical protein [Pseudobdellovibrionaceae bacterium]